MHSTANNACGLITTSQRVSYRPGKSALTLTQHLPGADKLPGEGAEQEAEKNETKLEQNGIRRSSKGRKKLS